MRLTTRGRCGLPRKAARELLHLWCAIKFADSSFKMTCHNHHHHEAHLALAP